MGRKWRRGAQVTTLLSDTFTDTDATSLSSHTMDVGSGWTLHNGTWVITSNKARETATGSTTYVASAQASNADVTVTADITTPNATAYAGGLGFRITDSSNFWNAVFERDAAGTPYVQLNQVTTGSSTNRGSATLTSAITNATTQLQAVCNAAQIDVYVAGVLKITYASATFNQTTTRHGLAIYRDGSYAEINVDNFLVESLAASGQPAMRRGGLADSIAHPLELGHKSVKVF